MAHQLTVDDELVEFELGATILEVARARGIEIPTLCHLEGLGGQTACFLCVVEVDGADTLSAACSTPARHGMVVKTGSSRVVASRKMCLELLLSDHAGSCIGTCTTACPAALDIPGFLDEVSANDVPAALATIRRRLAFPAVLGKLCAGHCESACLRGKSDESLSVRQMHGFLAEEDLASAAPATPDCAPATGKRVAIVGAGPCGMAAAFYLTLAGHACVVHDAKPRAGGLLRYGLDDSVLDKTLLDAELAYIESVGLEFLGAWRLGRDGTIEDLLGSYDAVLLAMGATRRWTSERRTVDLEQARALGLQTTARGLALSGAMQTSIEGVFAAGEFATGAASTVRVTAAGRQVAASIDAFLRSGVARPRPRPYFHRTKMTEAEGAAFFDFEPAPRVERFDSAARPALALVKQEADRCLECACRSTPDCTLRLYADRYGVNPTRLRGERRELGTDDTHPDVMYEPGKCILCGLCIGVLDADSGASGLSVVGRGFESRVGVPLGRDMSTALGSSALRVAEVCPSGAFSRKR